MKARYLTLTVPPEQDGQEVLLLLRRVMGLSGAVVRRTKWLPDGITLDGVKVTTRARARLGQVLSARLSDTEDMPQPAPAEGPLDILYEDMDLAVVIKAAGVLVHPSHGHFYDTVGNYCMYRWRQAGEASGFHPVHRLDKGTTGLLVIAKHPLAQERLKQALHTGDFRRRYLAVCDGVPQPDQGVIDAPIGPVDGSLVAREVRADGKPSRTHYRVLRAQSGRALVELELETGRTHQIRVHLAHIGCPLTGDFLYGAEDHALIARPALHSAHLELTQPITGERLALDCPLPADMKRLLETETNQ